jgi:glucose-1-phosphate thymidylyltransferase
VFRAGAASAPKSGYRWGVSDSDPVARERLAELVGVIPAGGGAGRLAPLPCSKELLPLGFRPTRWGPRPKVIGNYLLDAFRLAGAQQAFWLIDRNKTDLVQYFGGGADFGIQLAFLPIQNSPSVVHTIAAAYGFLRDRHVLFGFPDIVFEPENALRVLWERLQQRGADVVLGAVPAPSTQAADRVLVGPDGRALEIRVKPIDSPWSNAWILAAWAPRFTRFLQEWLEVQHPALPEAGAPAPELYLGHVLQAAIVEGLWVQVETFQNGSFIDLGTAAGFARAQRRYCDLETSEAESEGPPSSEGDPPRVPSKGSP